MLVNWFSKFISSIKGEPFHLDKNIPIGYLLRILLSKVVCLIYGQIRLCTLKRVFIHPTATIKCSSKFKFGKNFNVSQGCYIDALSNEGLICKDNVSIGKFTTIECTGSIKELGEGIKIGNNVGLGSHGFFGCAGGVEIGENTIFGNYVSVHSENHNYSDKNTPIRLQGVNRKGIIIGRDCWIGAKVTILDGSNIGNGCVVAAGAVVRGKFPDYCVIGGIPAKIIKYRNE